MEMEHEGETDQWKEAEGLLSVWLEVKEYLLHLLPLVYLLVLLLLVYLLLLKVKD
jgi:hypothetical protein